MTRISKPYDPAKHLEHLFRWSFAAATIFAGALIINYYRKPLFGFEPTWDGDNFAFNLTIFLPLTITAVLISYFVVGHIIMGWGKMKNVKLKIIALILTTPILLLSFYQFFNVLRR